MSKCYRCGCWVHPTARSPWDGGHAHWSDCVFALRQDKEILLTLCKEAGEWISHPTTSYGIATRIEEAVTKLETRA